MTKTQDNLLNNNKHEESALLKLSDIKLPVFLEFEGDLIPFELLTPSRRNTADINDFINKKGTLVFGERKAASIMLKQDARGSLSIKVEDVHFTQSKEFLESITIRVNAELGRIILPFSEIDKLEYGSILKIQDRLAAEPVPLYMENPDVKIANAECVMVDEHAGVRIVDMPDGFSPEIFLAKESLENSNEPGGLIRVLWASKDMSISELLKLNDNSLVDFERPVFEPCDVLLPGGVVLKGNVFMDNLHVYVKIVKTPGTETDFCENLKKNKAVISNTRTKPERRNTKIILEELDRFLEQANTDFLALSLNFCHPQIAALLISRMSFKKIAYILPLLSPEVQVDITSRIGWIDKVSIDAIENVLSSLKKEAAVSPRRKYLKRGGAEFVSSIIQSVDRSTEANLVKGLKKSDPDLLKEILEQRKAMAKKNKL